MTSSSMLAWTDGMFVCCAVDHENMVGMKKVEAGDDLVPAKARKSKVKPKVKREEYAEWGGIGGDD